MTLTKEIPVAQIESLDLHQGDSLPVVAEKGATFLIQIVKAARQPSQQKRGSAGAWARKYAGIARLNEGETNPVPLISPDDFLVNFGAPVGTV